jgi:hypothetical protein
MMARLDQSEKTSAADSDGNGCFIAIALYGYTLRTVADKEELPTFSAKVRAVLYNQIVQPRRGGRQ